MVRGLSKPARGGQRSTNKATPSPSTNFHFREGFVEIGRPGMEVGLKKQLFRIAEYTQHKLETSCGLRCTVVGVLIATNTSDTSNGTIMNTESNERYATAGWID